MSISNDTYGAVAIKSTEYTEHHLLLLTINMRFSGTKFIKIKNYPIISCAILFVCAWTLDYSKGKSG